MDLEKSTYVTTSSNGRMIFRPSSGQLEVQIADADGTVRDTAMLGEDDLRSLLKDNFKATRKPREKTIKVAPNGKTKSRGVEATA